MGEHVQPDEKTRKGFFDKPLSAKAWGEKLAEKAEELSKDLHREICAGDHSIMTNFIWSA